ncbi:hypothetical protein KAR91_40815 [Candidatus Pacearchaeota archaeon]|nr:hypothetical protein [Candidatus Pacearchaeota archaeon]
MYKVYIAPILQDGTWDTEIDISDYVQDGGIGKIKRSIDSEDFDFGLFTFNDITIKCENVDGKFNNVTDHRSIFEHARNESKVRVVFVKIDGTESTRFKGIINEEGTRINAYQDEIKFKVLSYDSVLRSTKIEAGLLGDDVNSTVAFKSILNRPSITKILTYDETQINPSISITLDKASEYDNDSTSSVLSEMLKITNSVFLVEENDKMVIKNREPSSDITNFYGPYDLLGRENIIKIKEYNSGRHRLFTSVKVNSVEASDTGYQLQYGFKQKKFTLAAVLVENTLNTIAAALVDEFKAQKTETNITCPIEQFTDTDILDLARVYYPLRTERAGGFMPTIGISKIDEVDFKLPLQSGSLEIRDNVAFKVLGIEEIPKSQEISFKMRQIGTSDEDGYFTSLDEPIVGIAIVGVSIIASGGTGPFYAPYTNAAVVGESIVST